MAAGDQNLDALRRRVDATIADYLMNPSDLGLFKLAPPTYDEVAAKQINRIAAGAGYTAKTTVGSPSPSAVQVVKSASSPSQKELLFKFEARRTLDDPALPNEIVSQTVRAAYQKMDMDLFTQIATSDSSPHPQNGAADSPYAAFGGGAVYIADKFTMTPIGGGSTFTQENVFSLAFSAQNLATLYQKRSQYLDLRGLNFADGLRPKLIVGAGNALLAQALLAQQGRMLSSIGGGDGSGGTTNPITSTVDLGFAGLFDDLIIAPSASSFPANAFALWYGEVSRTTEGAAISTGPFGVHVRTAPWYKIEALQGSDDIGVYASYDYAIYADPTPDHYLFYSEP
jgi:hypothetical protein